MSLPYLLRKNRITLGIYLCLSIIYLYATRINLCSSERVLATVFLYYLPVLK